MYNNNATGFSAVGAGCFSSYEDYYGEFAFFWSSTDNGGGAIVPTIHCSEAGVIYHLYNKDNGYSVRCVRD